MELHVPLGLEEGDCIFSTLTDVHDNLFSQLTSPASYHGKVLDFEKRVE